MHFTATLLSKDAAFQWYVPLLACQFWKSLSVSKLYLL